MSGYKKVLAARQKVKNCKVQHLDLGGAVAGGVVGGMINPGMILPGAFAGQGGGAGDVLNNLGGAVSGLNPMTALKNHYEAQNPVLQQQAWQPGMTQGSQMVQQGVNTSQGAANQLGAVGHGLQGYAQLQQGVSCQLGGLAQQQQGLAAGYGGLGTQNQVNTMQQQALAAQLQQQALGGGPNPAQLQYQQNVNQAIQQSAGLAASQRGINPALAARMGQQNAAAMTQQAAGNAAQLQAQQQLAAQSALAQQQQAIGNSIQGGGNLLGARIGALGAAGGTYGNQIGGYGAAAGSLGAAGGAYGNQGQLGQGIANTGNTFYGTNVGAFGTQNQQSLQGQLGASGINAGVASGNTQMQGGIVGGLLGAAGAAGASAAGGKAEGGIIDGRPRVQGDSPKNDTVPTMLSPGEIVIPRSIVDHPHAPYLAADFVRQVLAGKGPKPEYRKMADGGEVPDPGSLGRSGEMMLAAQQNPGLNTLPDSPLAKYFQGATTFTGQPNPDYVPPGQGADPNMMPQSPYNPVSPMGDGALNVSPMAPSGGTVSYSQNPNSVPPDVGQPQGAGMPQPPDVMGAYNKAFGEERAGVKGTAEAEQRGAAAQQKVWEDAAQGQQVRAIAYNKQKQTLDQENAQLQKQFGEGKIDPGHYWSSMSTPNKVVAAISVALAGIGSGLTGQKNMAMEVINNAIRDDIDSQKANLGKTQSLLSMNLQKYGNLEAAERATEAQQIAITKSKLEGIVAKTGGEKAAAAGQMLYGQLDERQAQLTASVAQTQVANAFGAGALAGPDKKDFNIESLPKEMRERAVKIPGAGYRPARNEKEASEITEKLAGYGDFEKGLQEAKSFMANTGRTGWGTDENARSKVMADALKLKIKDLLGLNRINEYEAKKFEEMIPEPGMWRQDVGLAKINQLQRLVKNAQESQLSRLPGYKGSVDSSLIPVGN